MTILLFDGRQNEATLQMMNEVGVFPRLLELLQMRTSEGDEEGDEEGLQRLLMDMLYEMSRIQRVRIEDLGMFAGWVWFIGVDLTEAVLVDDDFVKGLFETVENLSYDTTDPYHYPVIRVLVSRLSVCLSVDGVLTVQLVLNEQFMISAHDPVDERSPSNPLTNKIIKILSMHGNMYKTFGENIILLINREGR